MIFTTAPDAHPVRSSRADVAMSSVGDALPGTRLMTGLPEMDEMVQPVLGLAALIVVFAGIGSSG